jgi:hypothetical protein
MVKDSCSPPGSQEAEREREGPGRKYTFQRYAPSVILVTYFPN